MTTRLRFPIVPLNDGFHLDLVAGNSRPLYPTPMSKPICLICKKPLSGEESDKQWLPFCCERCKLVDLSRWLGGDYVIPGHRAPNDRNDPGPDER